MRTNLIVMVLVAGVLSFSAASLESALEFQKGSLPSESFQPFGRGNVSPQLDKPAGDWVLPKFNAKKPVYGVAKLGDREHLLVLDVKNAKDRTYNQLYFDANGNRDLTDDAVVDGESLSGPTDSNIYVQFKPIDVTIVLNGKTLPYRVMPSFNCYLSEPNKDATDGQNWNNFNLSFSVRSWYSAKVAVNAKTFAFNFEDSNGNGRFDERLSGEAQVQQSDGVVRYMADRVYVGDTEKLNYEDGMTLPGKVYLDGSLYDLAVDTPGGKMTLTPAPEGQGTLKFPAEPERIVVRSKDGSQSVMAYRPGLSMKVPAGEYALATYQLAKEGPKNSRWSLLALATANSPFAAVGGGATTSLAWGEPFSPVVSVPDWSRSNFLGGGNNEVQLEFVIRGAGNEQVTSLQRNGVEGAPDIPMSAKNPFQPKEPTYKVIQADGEVVAQGAFEYG